jgi:hypothetical protein
MEHIAYKIALLLLVLAQTAWAGDDWMSWPSTYTHDPLNQRVDQYAQPVQPLAHSRADFQRSGYRSYRSTLQTGNSADNIHVVEQWGVPVEPYESWRFPFRPYGAPYQAWGPPTPYGIFNGNFGGGGFFPGPHAPTHQHGPNHPGGNYPGGNYPGGNYPGGNYPNPSHPGVNGYPSHGFPLTPPYQNQPWYDGTYPAAPPLDPSSDGDFFFKPHR